MPIDSPSSQPSRYPNRLRTEHIFPGNFIWYTDTRPGSKRDCPAYIFDVDIETHHLTRFEMSEPKAIFSLLFLDDMKSAPTFDIKPDTDDVTFDDSETNSLERSFMKATPREKALAYIQKRLTHFQNNGTQSELDFYIAEAEAHGLL